MKINIYITFVAITTHPNLLFIDAKDRHSNVYMTPSECSDNQEN